jgi:hypothetical protein
MIGYIYRPKRRRNGKVVFGRLYRARVRFPGEHKMRDIPLEVTEQRSAARADGPNEAPGPKANRKDVHRCTNVAVERGHPQTELPPGGSFPER